MTSRLKRTGVLACVPILLAVAVAAGQVQKPGKAAERGSMNVFNSVESRTTVVSCRPDAARIQKGDVLCELDPAELQERLAIQEISVRSVQADLHGARIAREVAAMAVTEYKEGSFVQEFVAKQAQIKVAEADLAGSEDTVDWTRRMFEKGYVSLATKITEELTLKKTRYALEQAQSGLKVLADFTKDRTIKELTGAVETARARELAKEAALQQAQSQSKRLDEQIRRCKVVAPVSGLLRHAAPIGPGAVVRDGQLIFQIDPESESSNSVK
jgi:multidrug resistance efflux pump